MHHHSTRRLAHARSNKSIYISLLLLSFHYVLTVYILSSYLSTWFSQRGIGILYAIASLFTIVCFLVLPPLIARFGNQRLMLFFIVINMAALVGLALGDGLSRTIIAACFVIHTTLVSVLSYHLDIFLEERTQNHHTGNTRGAYLTVANVAFVITPMIAGIVLAWGGYITIFMASTAFMVPLFALIMSTMENHSAHKPLPIVTKVRRFLAVKNIRNVFFAAIGLNFFYAWMTIYTPLYLSTQIGFSWDTIGFMFSIMLLPFVLIELPLGKIADKYLGEKELMATGFIILGAATATLPFLPKHFALWALALFMTRVGAAAVEIMVETYFFKQVSAEDTEAISFYRMAKPFGSLFAPAVAAAIITTFTLSHNNLQFLFLPLAGLMFLCLIPTLKIKDTK